jgi:hypothetical protein
MGFAQGPDAEHGDGAPREIPAGALCEIYAIDRTTGWVTIHFDLVDSGPKQPFRVEAIVDADMLTIGARTPLPRSSLKGAKLRHDRDPY